MPMYGYLCKRCGHVFDTIHNWGENPGKCEKCNSKRIERQINTGVVAIYKGSGFTKKV